MKYKCPDCNSENVLMLMVGWMNANDQQPEKGDVIYDADTADLYPVTVWCHDCAERDDNYIFGCSGPLVEER